MDDEQPNSFGKRKSGTFRKISHSQFDNGRHKRRNSDHGHNLTAPYTVDTVYRILCPVEKIGSVLGKGGQIVNAIRDETHAKIRVADAIPGADERVVIIYSLPPNKPGKQDNEYEDMQPHCPAQDALLKVHDRIVADEYLHGRIVQEKTEVDDVVTARILVPSNQVGCLLGKGGNVITKLRSDTGATIRILPSDHLPPCAMDTDELVQISGIPAVAKKALYEVSTLLHQHPRKENPPLDDLIYASTRGLYPLGGPMPPLSHGSPMWPQQHDAHVRQPMPLFGGYRNESPGYVPGKFSSGHVRNAGGRVDEFCMRILCATEKIGRVIGKGGTNVIQLEQQTGASIHVEGTNQEAEESVIIVSSKEAPWDPVSSTIQAVLQLQSRTSHVSEKGVTARLLVPSSKVGCLLGQGGHIINEMRRRTRADIRVYSNEDKPKCASTNEELVQISGDPSVVEEAITEIASRLRERTLLGANAATNPVPSGPFHGFSPSDGFSSRGLPPSGMTGAGNTFGHDHLKGIGQTYEAHRFPGPLTSPGYPNINNSMEVSIPNSAVPSVIGTGGSNISDIRQRSGARVKLHDPRSGASECTVEIHGSSEQMKAAQSLLQTFIASGGQNYSQPLQARRPY